MEQRMIRPIITAVGPNKFGPLALEAISQLWLTAAPAISPRILIPASVSPSAANTVCRNGQPPIRVQPNPHKTMPMKFQRALVWATGWPSKPTFSWLVRAGFHFSSPMWLFFWPIFDFGNLMVVRRTATAS
jgi:hypothetical protein